MNESDFINRLKKNFKQRAKWARKQGVYAYRLYHRDIPDVPVIVDIYNDEIVLWVSPRKKDESDAQSAIFYQLVIDSVKEALSISSDQLHVKYRQRQKGLAQQYEKLNNQDACVLVKEGGLTFECNLSDYLDTGLFLDHRVARDLCRKMVNGKRVLNLFSYTGAFTCYAADGGAKSTTTVDLNPRYIEWAKRNFQLNGFEESSEHRFIVQDCLRYLQDDVDTFDFIICDPPTFSNSKKMSDTFTVDSDYVSLITACLNRLSSEGYLFFSTNSRRFRLDIGQFPESVHTQSLTAQTIPKDFEKTAIHQSFLISNSAHPAK